MKRHTIYDYPSYYDLLFSWDRDAEASFYDRVLALNGVSDSEPILEIAVGSGQIARRLARLGRNVTGLDASSDMLDLLQQYSVAEGVNVRPVHADMTDFSATVTYGAAINPMNSFRVTGFTSLIMGESLSCNGATKRIFGTTRSIHLPTYCNRPNRSRHLPGIRRLVEVARIMLACFWPNSQTHKLHPVEGC